MNITKLVELGHNIWVFVLSGGPCGGKSTALALLVELLTARGYKTLIVPEAATKCILSVVVICDRGVPDGLAYAPRKDFEDLAQSVTGQNMHALSAERYHAVFHLQSAAIGAPNFYTIANNSARKESLEDAAALDIRTLEGWNGHPHHRIIANGRDVTFKAKIQQVIEEVFSILGDPIPHELEDKFLVDASTYITIPVSHSTNLLVQDYLIPTDPREEERVRARHAPGGVMYYHTRKAFFAPGERVQIERLVTHAEYLRFLERKDHGYATIKKYRTGFFWKNRYFELDVFYAPDTARGTVIMELEHIDLNTPYEMPPFVPVIRKVTGEKEYSNLEIAKRFRLLDRVRRE